MLHKRLSLEMGVIKNYENTLVHIKLYYLKILHIVSKVKIIILQKNVLHQCYI